MPSEFVLNVDLANVYRSPAGRAKGDLVTTMAWGDAVDVDESGSTDEVLKVRVSRFDTLADGTIQPVPDVGFIRPPRGRAPMDPPPEAGAPDPVHPVPVDKV